MLRFAAGDGRQAPLLPPADTSIMFDSSILHFRPLDSRANLFAD
ncbi:MAG TPA: hypothetical protein VGX48_04755 [Pyrinomonadaceae bacterium]|nr:hypothetical protein [Pyrinomonadaceae bacterium]